MSLRLMSREQYLRYTIDILGVRPGDFPGLGAVVQMSDVGGHKTCRFTELLDRFLQDQSTGWPQDDERAAEQLMERALHRARGAILLNRLHQLDGQKFYVPPMESYAERSDEYVRSLVLRSLDRTLRLEPRGLGLQVFDDIGVCLLEDIDPRQMEYVLLRLESRGEVEGWADQSEPGNRTIRATEKGLQGADRLAVESRAPGLLVEEAVARVESAIGMLSPDLVQTLRGLQVRVAEAREVSRAEVLEIASSCELVIQDFLGLDALWGGISEPKPDKDKTKDRLRILLRNRIPSRTERKLVESLCGYVLSWFGPLEEFIHKHRHQSHEHSDRRDAQRCVIYTYLLLADMVELLDL